MQLRITDSAGSRSLVRQINQARQRIEAAREQVSSGSRINRPSDDPAGAATVIRLKTRQAEIIQLRRSAEIAGNQLRAADEIIDSYQQELDRARVLLSQGASQLTSETGRQAIALQLENIGQQLLTLANSRSEDRYLFGGTRQDAPPFDETGVATGTPASVVLLQVEPQAEPIITGIKAESVFADDEGTVFSALNAVVAALRNTGDDAADQRVIFNGLDRLRALAEQAGLARTGIGAGQAHLEIVSERLTQQELSVATMTESTEAADFAAAATTLSSSQRAFEAILEANAPGRRRSLIDLLG